MNQSKSLKAGVVGLGMIGGGVAVSLVRRDRVPSVFDIRPDASANLAGVPDPLPSPAEVARNSDVVMVAVLNADQAREVIIGEDGLLSGSHSSLTIVLLSTVAISVVQELGKHCASKQVGFLDCGVTPGDKAAENGMVAMVGGEGNVVERAMPVLQDWAKKVIHCGPLGTGMATKIARNIITYGSWRAVAEATILADTAGVDYKKLIDVVESSDPEGKTLLQLLRLRSGDGNIPKEVAGYIETLMTKDLEAAKELAYSLGVQAPLTDVTRNFARQTLELAEEASHIQGNKRERGLEFVDRTFGPGFRKNFPEETTKIPFLKETVEHLFADIWSRPGISIRDRRLLAIGANAFVGRADLLQVQLYGALVEGELSVDQVNEVVLQLTYYVGWGKGTAVAQAGMDAINAYLKNKEGKE